MFPVCTNHSYLHKCMRIACQIQTRIMCTGLSVELLLHLIVQQSFQPVGIAKRKGSDAVSKWQKDEGDVQCVLDTIDN